MNKKLIAAAVAAGLMAPMAAQAEITPYAQVQFEVANVDDGTDSGIWVTDRQRGRWGLKGSHDLGNGMSSFAMVEFDLEGGNRDAEFGGNSNADRIREANAGIKGSFGTVTIGTLKSAYKYTGGVKYDPFVTTTLEARGQGGMTGGELNNSSLGHNGFLSDAISYQNKFGNMSLWVTYNLDETDNNNNAIDADDVNEHDGQFSAALKFSADNFEAFVSAVDAGGGDDVAYDSTKIGGQFKSGPHKISAQYEMSDEGGVEFDTMFLGYQMTMGKNTFVAQLGNQDYDAGGELDYMAIGVWHKMNKQTGIFAGYRSSDPSVGQEDTSLSVGLRVAI